MIDRIKFTGDTIETEKYIRNKHFMKYSDWCEIKLQTPIEEDGVCYKCGKLLEPLTNITPDYFYVPCWSCMPKRKTDKGICTEEIIQAIREYYSLISGDRYYQLFVVDDIYFKTTLPHTYGTFKKIINLLNPPSRNDIWLLDWVPGYPHIISEENLNGLIIKNITEYYNGMISDKDFIKIGEYEIRMPEFTTFNQKHHSSYSILNKNGDRKSKRIKLGDRCLKFYNTEDPNTKAIFKIYKNGEEITYRNISNQDFAILKLAVMRNKTFIKLIFDVIEEVCRSVGTIRDSIFLKNTVHLNPKTDLSATIIWNYLSEYKDDSGINISIF